MKGAGLFEKEQSESNVIEEERETAKLLPQPRAHQNSKLKQSWIFDKESVFDVKNVTINLMKTADQIL